MQKNFLKNNNIIAVFITLMMLSSGVLIASAQTKEELEQKIAEKNSEIKKLEQDIKQYQGDIATLNTKKKTLKNAITELDVIRKKLEADIRVTQTKVDKTDLSIRKLSSEILYKEDEITARAMAIKEAIRSIYEREAYSLSQIALSQDSFSGVWTDIDTLSQFNVEVEENIEVLKKLKVDLEEKNKKQQAEKGKLLDLKSELGDQKKITEDNKKQKTKLLAQTSNQESQYQKTLRETLARKEALEKELSDYESTLKFILDPSSIPPRGTKVFSAPLDSVYLTQKFGKTNAKNSSGQRLYASGTHNGIDFRATMGTPVKAMSSGVVVGTGDTDLACPGASFGKWVLIDHQNGLTSVSAHLSLVSVSAGDVITDGQRIGYSGNTGYSTGPHLHISVYASKAVNVETRPSKACGGRTYTMPIAALNGYLDPLDYIKL